MAYGARILKETLRANPGGQQIMAKKISKEKRKSGASAAGLPGCPPIGPLEGPMVQRVFLMPDCESATIVVFHQVGQGDGAVGIALARPKPREPNRTRQCCVCRWRPTLPLPACLLRHVRQRAGIRELSRIRDPSEIFRSPSSGSNSRYSPVAPVAGEAQDRGKSESCVPA